MSHAAPAESAGTTPIPSAGGLSHRQILTILSGLLLGMFLAALDQTIVSTSIRTIADDLHGLSQQAWATTAYLITSTISTPLYGKLSDLHGRKPYFLTAISVFIVGSALCTFSTSMTELAAFRAFQGLGAGGLMSLALAIIGDIVPPRQRARYQGYMLATFGVSSVGGPLIGGFLAGQDSILGVVGWRWVFLVNVPIGIIALFVVAKVLNIPHTRRASRIDWWGALTLIIGVVPLLLVAEQGRGWGWSSTWSLTCYGIGAVGIIVWIFVERVMGDAALIPMRLFRIPVFSLTSVAGVLIGMGMFGGMLVIPQYLQIVKGASATRSGLEMLPLMAGMIIASITSGQVTSRTGRYKIFPIIGSALMVIAMGLFYFRVEWDTPLWQTMIFMAVFGLGLGCCMQTLVLAVQNAVPLKDMGVATSSSTFFRQMGGTAGTAIFLSVLFSTVSGKIASAFTAAASTTSFQAALKDPAVLADPANKPVLGMLKGGSGGSSADVLSDSSFIQKLDPRLAVPFKAGFADAMHNVFLLAAIVMVVAFVVILFLKEVPLRQISGLEARAAESAAGAPRPEQEQERVDAGPAQQPQPEPQLESEPQLEPERQPQPQLEPERQPEPVGAFASPGGNDVPLAVANAVHGQVRGADGTPAVAATLTLVSHAGQQLGRAAAEADGSYTIPVPGAGSYVLIAAADGRQPQATTITVGDEPVSHDVLLSASGGLAGVVSSELDNLPVEGAMAMVTDVLGNVLATAKTDASGGFTLPELPAGEYTVAVHADGCRPTARLVQVGGAGITRLEIALQPGAQVQGSVRAGADHRLLPDARLTLLDTAGNVVGTATTGPDGAYAFTDLDAGGYSLIASGYPPVATSVRVEGRGVENLDIELGHDAR